MSWGQGGWAAWLACRIVGESCWPESWQAGIWCMLCWPASKNISAAAERPAAPAGLSTAPLLQGAVR